MAATFERVRPGDVITSDLINRILGTLEDLDQRLGGAGTGTSPVITTLDPPNEQVVGGRLTINGNFDTPLNGNTVMIDSIAIPATTFITGSDGTKLIFFVPSTLAVPAGTKRPVVIRVQTLTKGSAERNYLLSPTPTTGVPNPSPTNITAVENTTLSPNQIEMGRTARINGTNLAPSPTVVFITQAGNRIPAPVTSSTATQIVLRVPSVPGVTVFLPGSVTVEVTIPGAGLPGNIANVAVLAP